MSSIASASAVSTVPTHPDGQSIHRPWARLATNDELEYAIEQQRWLDCVDALEDAEVSETTQYLRDGIVAAAEKELSLRRLHGLQHTGGPLSIPRAILDDLRQRTDLAALIAETVVLRQSGKRHNGCCPWHDDRFPSLAVYPDGGWRCFGCGLWGDAIAWLQLRDQCEFRDAVEILASRVGLRLVREATNGR